MTECEQVSSPAILKPKRGRKKIYTNEEYKKKETIRVRKYYHDHKETEQARRRRYTEYYRMYVKILQLIEQKKAPEQVVKFLMETNVVTDEILKSVNLIVIKDKNIINELPTTNKSD